jgi:uncharacterized protein
VEQDFRVGYFKPTGLTIDETTVVLIEYEQLEAIRLVDLEGLTQKEAAEKMGIARTTFWKELEAARRKIADALVNGKAIQIAGGDYKMVGRGMGGGTAMGPGGECVCPKCGYTESHGRGEQCFKKICPKCGEKLTRK